VHLSAGRAVLLDTCAAIWLMERAPLSQRARQAIEAAITSQAGVFVSPISAWEMATLVSKGRIRMSLAPEVWFASLLALPGIHLAAMPPAVLIASASLPGTPPRDPADRIIAATSRAYGYTIVTRDGELIPYGEARHITAIAC
jgi:PIN domain nuclease of toxin-antitoxin system